MKKISLKFKIIFSLATIVSLSSFATLPKVYALASGSVVETIELPGPQLVATIKTQIEQTLNTVSAGTSAYADTWQMLKEGGLDSVAQIAAKMAIEQIKQQTINWVNSGFKGKPMFLQNPDQFFNNIMVDQLALVKNKMMADLGNLNRGITQQLIKDVTNQSKVFQQNMKYTIANDICSVLKSDLASYQAMPNSADKTQLINAKNNQINSVCNGDDTTRDTNAKACAGDFACGGWGAILAKTSNLDLTTDAGKLAMAKQEFASRASSSADFFNTQLNRNGGYFDQLECVKYEKIEGREVCAPGGWRSKAPGSSVQAQVNKVATDQFDSLNNVDEFLENLIVSAVQSFATNMINKGISGMTNIATSAINDTSNELQTALNDLANDRPVGTTATNTATTTVNPGYISVADAGNQLSSQDRSAFVSTINPKYDFILKNHQEITELIAKEKDAWTKLKNAIDQVAQCYKDKSAMYPNLIAPFPNSVPQKLRDRAAEVNSKVEALNQSYQTAVNLKNKADALYDKMNKTNNFSELRVAMDEFNELYRVISNGASYWQSREVQNNTGDKESLYAKIDEEIKTITGPGTTSGTGETMTTSPSALAQCQAIGMDTSGGGF